METITLKTDLPGVPKGTVFTKDKSGNFVNGQFWLSPKYIEENPEIIEPPEPTQEELLVLQKELTEQKTQVEQELVALEAKLIK